MYHDVTMCKYTLRHACTRKFQDCKQKNHIPQYPVVPGFLNLGYPEIYIYMVYRFAASPVSKETSTGGNLHIYITWVFHVGVPVSTILFHVINHHSGKINYHISLTRIVRPRDDSSYINNDSRVRENTGVVLYLDYSLIITNLNHHQSMSLNHRWSWKRINNLGKL